MTRRPGTAGGAGVLAYRLPDCGGPYEKIEVGAGLRGEVDRLEKAESEARAALEGVDPDVRDRASLLLRTPDGMTCLRGQRLRPVRTGARMPWKTR